MRHREDWLGESLLIVWVGAVVIAAATTAALGLGSAGWSPRADVLNQAWGWASSCTASVPAEYKNAGASLGNVRWGRFAPGARDDSLPGRVLGVTTTFRDAGFDSISVDDVHADSVWVLAHELVHHILGNTDSLLGAAHPFFPFAFPCHLLEFQQPRAGGFAPSIMQQGSRP